MIATLTLSGPRGVAPREVRALALALDHMRGTIERRADFIAAFATELGHELKTPVTAIRGAAELLRDGWESMSKTQRERFLANLDSDAARLQDLVRQLLELARILRRKRKLVVRYDADERVLSHELVR